LYKIKRIRESIALLKGFVSIHGRVGVEKKADRLVTAMERMVRRFPDARVSFMPGNDIAYERCRFLIPDMTIRRLYLGP
jgi:hypothetical protein